MPITANFNLAESETVDSVLKSVPRYYISSRKFLLLHCKQHIIERLHQQCPRDSIRHVCRAPKDAAKAFDALVDLLSIEKPTTQSCTYQRLSIDKHEQEAFKSQVHQILYWVI